MVCSPLYAFSGIPLVFLHMKFVDGQYDFNFLVHDPFNRLTKDTQICVKEPKPVKLVYHSKCIRSDEA